MDGKYKRKRRKRRRKRILVAAAFMLVVLVTAAVVCLVMFFNITDITAIGVSRYAPQEIIDASGIQLQQNIFAMNTGKIEDRLMEQFPYIEDVDIVRVLPTVVEIHIKEAEPAITIINSQDSYTLLSAAERILEQGTGVSDDGLILVVGADFSDFTVGSYPSDADPEATEEELERAGRCEEILLTIQRVREAVESSGIDRINYIDVGDELCTILLYDDRAILKIGSELDLEYKLALAREVLENQLDGNFEGTVDLTIPSRAYTLEESITDLVNQDYWEAY